MLLGLTTAIYEILGAIFRAIKQKSLMGLFKYWWVLLCSYFKHCRGSCNFYWHVKNCKRLLVRSKTIMKLYWSLIIHLFMVFFFYIYHTQYTTKEKPNIQSCSHKKKKRELKLKARTISLICFASDLDSYPLSNLQQNIHFKLPIVINSWEAWGK